MTPKASMSILGYGLPTETILIVWVPTEDHTFEKAT
jgi:hypothetical protein